MYFPINSNSVYNNLFTIKILRTNKINEHEKNKEKISKILHFTRLIIPTM